MKTLFKYIATALLFCAALNVNAQISYTVLQGKLSFSRDMIAACPLLKKGDTATIYQSTYGLGKTTVNYGTVPFTTATSSGWPVAGEGTLIASSSGGTIYVTALTVGYTNGTYCSFVNLNVPVNLNVHRYRFNGDGF